MRRFSFLFSLLAFALLVPVTPAQAQLPIPDDQITTPAPDSFQVAFETTKGRFDVKAYREASPNAADRFYHLVRLKYFDEMVLYRVVPGFVVQWGIHDSADVNRAWKDSGMQDEPVKMLNERGSLSFARAGANSRTVQLFINYRHNTQLDTISYGGTTGFPAFAKVVSGMDVVDQFNGDYGDAPTYQQAAINVEGRAFLDKHFPGLDVIQRAYFIKEED